MAGLRWSTRDQWHVTLRFLGELGTPEVETTTRALAGVGAALGSGVPVQGGPSTTLLRPGLIVWPVAGLQALATAVTKVTAGIGQATPDRPFSGHLTIARGSVRSSAARHLLQPLSAEWTVGSFSLVQSELHPQGARYRVMQLFSLGGAVPLS